MMTTTAATLFAQLYRSVCATCLSLELGVTEARAEAMARQLAAGPSFRYEWSVCSGCREQDMVIQHVPVAPLALVAAV